MFDGEVLRILIEEVSYLLRAEERAERIRSRTGKPVKIRLPPSRVPADVRSQLVVHRVVDLEDPAT